MAVLKTVGQGFKQARHFSLKMATFAFDCVACVLIGISDFKFHALWAVLSSVFKDDVIYRSPDLM